MSEMVLKEIMNKEIDGANKEKKELIKQLQQTKELLSQSTKKLEAVDEELLGKAEIVESCLKVLEENYDNPQQRFTDGKKIRFFSHSQQKLIFSFFHFCSTES
jgi:DNA gyrase/topoisomerase IV subunit A